MMRKKLKSGSEKSEKRMNSETTVKVNESSWSKSVLRSEEKEI